LTLLHGKALNKQFEEPKYAALSLRCVNHRGASVRSAILRVPLRKPLRTECWSSGKNISRHSDRKSASVIQSWSGPPRATDIGLRSSVERTALIFAGRERHRQGTRIELAQALAVCVSTRLAIGGLVRGGLPLPSVVRPRAKMPLQSPNSALSALGADVIVISGRVQRNHCCASRATIRICRRLARFIHRRLLRCQPPDAELRPARSREDTLPSSFGTLPLRSRWRRCHRLTPANRFS
jgi:hypothetical protein